MREKLTLVLLSSFSPRFKLYPALIFFLNCRDHCAATEHLGSTFIMFLGSSELDPEMAHQMFSSGRKVEFLCRRIVNVLAT